MIWMIFTKILKNTIQMKNVKNLMVFDNMIADMLSNKKLDTIITGLFIIEKKKYFSCFYYTILLLFQKILD